MIGSDDAGMGEHLLCPPPAGCHFGCGDCESQYLSIDDQQSHGEKYLDQFTDEEARDKIDSVLKGIDLLRVELSRILETQGDLIITRWSKKSKDKRAVLLGSKSLLKPLLSGPDDESHHLDRWIKSNGRTWVGARWMAIKPFAEDRVKLLSLLHLRTDYPPSAWALTDTRQSMASFGYPDPTASKLYFNAKCVKMFEDEYGALTDWDDGMTHSWAIMGFPRAFMTLVIQLDIMRFLMETTAKVIQDAAGTGSSNWSALVAGGFRGSGCEALWSAYTSPAFAPPTFRGFDAEWMLQKAQARFNVCLDDIWVMQVDPTFMHYTIRGMKASIVYDTTTNANANVRWEHLPKDLIMDAFHRLSAWHTSVRACNKALAGFQRFGDEIGPGKVLPREVGDVLRESGSEIGPRLRLQNYVFDKLLPSRAPMKSRFRAYHSGGSVRHQELPRMDHAEGDDRLAYLMYRLQADIVNGSLHVSMTFDMLERELLAQGPASRVDKRMLDQLSDIMTMDDMRQMVLWNQLGFGTSDAELAQKPPAEFDQHMVRGSMNRGVRLEPRTISRLARLLRQFAEAPWPKGRKSLAWLDAATESRKRLAAFWAAMREELKQAQILSGVNMERNAVGTIEFDTEPQDLAYLEQERREWEQASQRAEAAALAALSELTAPPNGQTVWGSGDETAPVRRKQTKAKASRNTNPSQCDDLAIDAACLNLDNASGSSGEDDAPLHELPILVKQDSIGVFHKMFPISWVQGREHSQAAVRPGHGGCWNDGHGSWRLGCVVL